MSIFLLVFHYFFQEYFFLHIDLHRFSVGRPPNTSIVNPDLGLRAATQRSQLGRSQTLVQSGRGLAGSDLSRIENGRIHPTLATDQKIAAPLRIPLSVPVGPTLSQQKNRGHPLIAEGARFPEA
jgi:hypothetical protein